MHIDSTAGVELLLDVGLERRVLGSEDAEIRVPGGSWTRWDVKVLHHSPSPVEIRRALELAARGDRDGVFFVVAKAGTTLTKVSQQDSRVSYASLRDRAVSFLGRLHQTQERDAPVLLGAIRPSWARTGMLRLFALLDDAVLSQSEIARRLGVSHVAVGKQLPSLVPLVQRTPQGWRTTDRDACAKRFFTDYPGPRGLATFWAATGTITEQLERVESAVRDAGGQFALSGDVAADFYAPWRRPTRITAYVDVQPFLEDRGFAAVPEVDATVELRTPKDPTILPMSRTGSVEGAHKLRYVDPLLAAWDMTRTPGGDVAEAVARLRERALRETLWR